ncbi:hypothetical protein RDWZM_004603 [Blomia tropicalis]|uniref:K Homology domain-containing protein n=1 Tax=Blomia tropicalis TaxID=40697 RepID=A0A9Q0M3T7_BLOTA|nr:hypothetical protein RDWZM_004603 [Blomia tropicalis]
MPASLMYEFDNANNVINGLEERRALELALELSLLGLGNDENVGSLFSSPNGGNRQLTSSATAAAAAATATATTAITNGNGHNFDNDARLATKRSQNTTECVPVPSSEHVAEIVGRQGCKIKALRAKTNTYIKTPVRGEEPVFVVTGRKEDVGAAKREILSAAEHFSQIRAQRKNNPGSVGPAPNAHLPGHITIQVRVPYRVVGLVVGPKGATIKRIQQQTNTYIITPSRDKDPVFEVTGLHDDVETARKEIEAHIAIRTGGIIDSHTGSVGTPDESGSSSDFSNSPLLSSLDSNPFSTLTNGMSNYISTNSMYNNTKKSSSNADPFATFAANFNNGKVNSTSSSLLSNSPTDIFSNCANNSGSYDTDEGLGDSPTFDIITNSSVWSDFSLNQPQQQRQQSQCVSSFNLMNIGNKLDDIQRTNILDFHSRSSSLDSNIDSSIASSSCLVSSSAPTKTSII